MKFNKQIVPASWISESTETYSVADTVLGLGYGYMWGTIPAGSPAAQMLGSSGFFHTGSGGHALILFPTLKVVMVERVNTDGGMWVDPGDAGMRLRLMILNARN